MAVSEDRIVGYNPPDGSTEATRLLRLKIMGGHSLAKKDIFGASDPYTRIDLVNVEGNDIEDSVLTKTKKRTLNPKWDEEFIFRVIPGKHKLVFEVFDENRLTRDDFLGMVELPIMAGGNIPQERQGRNIPHKYYILRPRSAKSKVKGHLQLYHAFIPDEDHPEDDIEAEQHGDSNRVPTRATEEDWEIVGNSEAAATSLQGGKKISFCQGRKH